MSVLIKGMEKPKNCEGCNFAEWMNGTIYCHCIRYATVISEMEQLLSLCPLVEVPTPHGRLIDADKIQNEMYCKSFETDDGRQKWDSGLWIRYKVFEESINNVPTVIESEE